MSNLICNRETKYNVSKINIHELLGEITYLFEYDEHRDEDFYKYSSEIKYDNSKINHINTFYKELCNIDTTLKNKRTILNKYFENIFYNKVNHLFNELKENPILLETYDLTFLAIDKISIENEWWTHESDIRHKMYILFILISNSVKIKE